MNYLNNDLILVIGGYGTIGNEVCRLLSERNANYIAVNKKSLDFLDYNLVMNYLNFCRPKYIINLMAVKTNISKNKKSPFDIYAQTVQMNTNLFAALTEVLMDTDYYKPEKIISVVSSCAYGDTGLTLVEDKFDTYSVNQSIAPHGNAKRNLYYLAQYARQQYEMNAITLCFNNIYGGVDWNKPYDLKVCDALIKKFVDARRNEDPSVTIFGTGKPRREFLYYTDAAESILQVLKKYDDGELLNIGCGWDISIMGLAKIIKEIVGYGEIRTDKSKPDGQMNKLLSNQKMKTVLYPWEPSIGLKEGIEKTALTYERYLGYETKNPV